MIFKMEAEIATAVYKAPYQEGRMDISFAPIGLGDPYRVIISEDPIRFSGGDVNFYAYVKNRPTMLVDPSGNLPASSGDWLTEINRLKKAGKLCYECNDIEKHINPPKSNGMHRECIKCCEALSKIYEGIINLRDSIRDACLEKLCMPK